MESTPHSRISRLRQIYQTAVQLDAAQRAEYLNTACQGDRQLLSELERMLQIEVEPNNPLRHALDCLGPIVEQQQWSKPEQLDAWENVVTDSASQLRELPELAQETPYMIIRKLGEGGMGAVYLASQDPPLQRHVAIKVVKPGMDSREVLTRFRNEQKALARLNHPHVARVYDSGQTERGHPFFVMEFVEGLTIDEYCLTHKTSLECRLKMLIDVCSAVHHAHQQGIVHRDLKPSNILVAEIDGRPNVKVIDFGVAKALDQGLGATTKFTNFAQWIGTPQYMSPEQVALDGTSIDERSDVYSLGALSYLLLTGSPTFERQTLYSAGFDGLRDVIANEDPPAPSIRVTAEQSAGMGIIDASSWRTQVRGDLDHVVLQALAKEPDRRYPSAQALADDLQRFLNHEPVKAVPPSPVYRLRKAVRRRPTSFVSTILTTLLAIACMVVMVQAVRFRDPPVSPAEDVDTLQRIAAADLDIELQLQRRATLDISEAAGLQQQLIDFSKNDLSAVQASQLPRDEGGLLLGCDETSAAASPAGSLRQMLSAAASPKPRMVFEHPDAVTDAVVSPDLRWVATTCSDGWLRVWDAQSGRLQRSLGPHAGPAESLAFSPDGTRVASGDKEGGVYAWEVATGDLVFATGEREDGGIESLTWSPDGQLIAVGVRYAGVDLLRAEDGSS